MQNIPKIKSSGLDWPGSDEILRLYFQIQRLKNLYRRGWMQVGLAPEHDESVADHSYMTTVLAVLIAQKHYPQLDLQKIMLLSLFHEMGEIYTGDLTPWDGVDKHTKHQREEDAVKRVFADTSLAEDFIALWQEFESGTSPEAEFVRQLDRLELALQAHYYHQTTGIPVDGFYQSTANSLIWDELTEIFRCICPPGQEREYTREEHEQDR